MIDGNQLREEFGRYLAEHKATRWGMDAALMHVCKIAYDAGKADGPGAALHSQEFEIEVPAEPGIHPLKFTGLPLQNWRDEQLHTHIQRRVPEGWQVVPIDPTPEMLDAAEGVDWGDEDMRGSCCNQWHAMLAAAPDHFRDAAEMVAEPADDRIAAALHYPECWDTAAYPTVESALSEVYAHYRCTEHDAPAEVPMPEPVDDIDRALVPLSDHDRLTIGPGPWAGVRIGQKAFNVARAVFGTSSEDDDKRVYRTLQAYEQNRTQISGESTQADFERWLERDSTLPATRDGGTYSDFSVALMWHAWQECAACRAAGEAAGYARGRAEAERDAERLKPSVLEIEELRLYARALCKAVDAATDFIGTVAGGASWWDDVWADHAAALDRARERISQAALRGEVKP